MAQFFAPKTMQLKRVGNGSSKMQFQTDERLFLSKKSSSLFFTRGGVRVTILNSNLQGENTSFQPTCPYEQVPRLSLQADEFGRYSHHDSSPQFLRNMQLAYEIFGLK